MSTTRRQILSHLNQHPASTPVQISEELGIDRATARQTLRRMATDQQIESDGQGSYSAPSPESLSQVSQLSLITGESDSPCDTSSSASMQVTGLSDTCDTCDSDCRDCGHPLDPSLLAAGDHYHATCGAA